MARIAKNNVVKEVELIKNLCGSSKKRFSAFKKATSKMEAEKEENALENKNPYAIDIQTVVDFYFPKMDLVDKISFCFFTAGSGSQRRRINGFKAYVYKRIFFLY